MNDLPKEKFTLSDIRKMSVEEALMLDDELLLRAQHQADKAAYSAALMLDWIRGIIARKRTRRHFDRKTDL